MKYGKKIQKSHVQLPIFRVSHPSLIHTSSISIDRSMYYYYTCVKFFQELESALASSHIRRVRVFSSVTMLSSRDGVIQCGEQCLCLSEACCCVCSNLFFREFDKFVYLPILMSCLLFDQSLKKKKENQTPWAAFLVDKISMMYIQILFQ